MRQEKTWESTSVQGVYRHKSGRLYARIFSNRKERWFSLKTQVLEVAKSRYLEIATNYDHQARTLEAAEQGRMTVGDCLRLYEDKIKEGFSLHGAGRQSRRRVAPRTVAFRLEIIRLLVRSWPELPGSDVRKITPQDCEAWADALCRRKGKGGRTLSACRFNSLVDSLRHVFAIAIKANARYGNPAGSLGKMSVQPKLLVLPSREKFLELVALIRNAGGRFSRHCADYVEFLAYTGARKNEAAHVLWRDIDFVKATILLRVTKNGRSRYVPMIAEARRLLERLAKEGTILPDAPVLKVREAQKALDRAAQKARIVRMTHHDMRHLFATVCIESGVDIPTVSRWLGHLDGGTLAMRTYGHLRDEHSRYSATKVHFTPLPRTGFISIGER